MGSIPCLVVSLPHLASPVYFRISAGSPDDRGGDATIAAGSHAFYTAIRGRRQRRGFIRIAHGPHTAAAMFQIPATGSGLRFGCDLSKTDARFLYTPLIQWIPENTLNALFDKLEASRNTNFEPVVSDIVNEECTPDPANPATGDSSAPGILSFQAEIKFLVPK